MTEQQLTKKANSRLENSLNCNQGRFIDNVVVPVYSYHYKQLVHKLLSNNIHMIKFCQKNIPITVGQKSLQQGKIVGSSDYFFKSTDECS